MGSDVSEGPQWVVRAAGPVARLGTAQVPHWRQRRLDIHLATLRETLRGVALSARDHELLAWLADQETSVVGSIVNLLDHARQAGKDTSTTTDDTREQRLAHTFVELSDTLVDDFDLLDFLTLLAERAAELLDVTAVGVILSDQRGGWQPTAASSEDARLLQLFATQTHEGPCQDCIRDTAPVVSADLAGEDTTRWPAFTEAATAAGFRAAAAVPLRVRREIVGALTLLNTEPTPVDEDSLQLGQALADVATVGLLHQRSVHHGGLLSEQLQATLHQRVVIEQAKGVLAEHGQLDMQQAFELLRGYARDNGLHLSELARTIAEGTIDPTSLLAYHACVGLKAPG